MIYKLVDKTNEYYIKLKEQLDKEQKATAENDKLLIELIPFKWDSFRGRAANGFFRLNTYRGFCPKDENQEPPKGWRKVELDGRICFMPNKKTKKGREIAEKLDNMQNFVFWTIYDIIHFSVDGRQKAPLLYIIDEIIYLIIDDRFEPKDEAFIEITHRELKEVFEGKRNG